MAVTAEIVPSTTEIVAAVIVSSKVEIRSSRRASHQGEPANHLAGLLLTFGARHELENVGHRHTLVEAVVATRAEVFVKGQAKTPGKRL